jgi:hypothetical protein
VNKVALFNIQDLTPAIDSDASGRFICEVAMDGDKGVQASYVNND